MRLSLEVVSLDLAAELKFFLGAEARPTRGLVHVQRQGVRFARAFVARRDAADQDFAEVRQVGTEEGGEGVGLGGAGGDVVDHKKERGLYI